MTVVALQCRGCGRKTAYAKDKYHKVFCAAWCAAEPPALPNEERDDLLTVLHARGWSPDRLSEKFGITRQRTHQILQERAIAA